MMSASAGSVTKSQPMASQHAHDVLAVGHVLLAAEGVHQRVDGLAPLDVHGPLFFQ